MKWSKQKVLTGGYILWGRLALRLWLYRPCAIDFIKFIGLFIAKKNTVLWLIIRTIKVRYKKYYLFFKMIISICVNRKLLRLKSTSKQENNRTLKRTVLSHSICSDPSPRGLQHGLPLYKIEKFKFLGVVFMSNAKQNKDWCSDLYCTVNVVLRELHRFVVIKTVKRSGFKSIFVPTLILSSV